MDLRNMTHICVLLDESGSMSVIKDSILEGLNKFVLSQKKEGESLFTLITFSEDSKIIINSELLSKVKEITSYDPNNGTALYDSVARAIECIHDKGICVIITDGQDNKSQVHTKTSIKEEIEKVKSRITFVYLANNIENAEQISTPHCSIHNVRDYGTVLCSQISDTVKSFRN